MATKVINKWFWVWDFDKEEQWLNTMAESRWVLERVNMCKYTFKSCEPGEYSIRLEMHHHDEAYIHFMEETGAEYVGRMAQWIYFRKKTSDGEFDIFSDLDSRSAHLRRIAGMLTGVGAANLIIGLANTFNQNVAPLGCINLLCAALLAYALGRIHGKKESLEDRRRFSE